jgi:magnesium transporter
MPVRVSPKKTRDAILKRIAALKNLKNIPHLLSKVGKPPGTLLYTGTKAIPTKIDILAYNKTHSDRVDIADVQSIQEAITKDSVNWINISGLQNTEVIASVGNTFNIHPLILEDILNVEQQPKFEDYEHYSFMTLKMLFYRVKEDTIVAEHFSMIIQDRLVITFCESDTTLFDQLRERILTSQGLIRNKGASYLAYRLVDTIVDHYYHVINLMDEQLENQETTLLKSPGRDQIHEILHLKKQVLLMRKASDPLRDGLRRILNLDTSIWKHDEKVFFNDVYDHIQQMITSLELQRETLLSLTDLYMSVVSNKMNEVMKTLTIIATIFIPLTFIAGIYGMNFQNMPELEWEYGYFAALGFMSLAGIGMFLYMKSRHWF